MKFIYSTSPILSYICHHHHHHHHHHCVAKKRSEIWSLWAWDCHHHCHPGTVTNKYHQVSVFLYDLKLVIDMSTKFRFYYDVIICSYKSSLFSKAVFGRLFVCLLFFVWRVCLSYIWFDCVCVCPLLFVWRLVWLIYGLIVWHRGPWEVEAGNQSRSGDKRQIHPSFPSFSSFSSGWGTLDLQTPDLWYGGSS